MPKDLAIFTHNHPSGCSFSPADISTAVRENLGELRVCSKVADYSLRPKVSGWSSRIKNRVTAGRNWGNDYEFINQSMFSKFNKMASDEYLIRLSKAHAIDGSAEADLIWEEVKHDVNRIHSHVAMLKFAEKSSLGGRRLSHQIMKNYESQFKL